MKVIVASAFILALSCAELPPSNSYLPPPPGRGSSFQGSQGISPEVIAARSFGAQGNGQRQGAHGVNGFGRSGSQGRGQVRSGYESSGYDQNASAFARNGLDETNAEPAHYNFGYMVNDYQQGTDFGHHEERQEERAQGGYHVVLPDGRKQTVNYEADERGFKPQISYQDTDSGYDSNANNFRNNLSRNGNHGNGFGANDNGYHGDGIHHNDFKNGANSAGY